MTDNIKKQITGEGRHLFLKMKTCLYWVALSVAAGIIVGVYSSLFAYILKLATEAFAAHGWILYLLPFAGLIIVFLYRAAGTYNDRGTNLVIGSINSDMHVPGKMAVLIFISTILTHLTGGSAGREGAALQMGGSFGNVIARVLKRNERDTKVLIMCGMSAAFAAVFGTPMAAVVFSMEVISVGIMHYSALVPCVFASIIASRFAAGIGIDPEAFILSGAPALSAAGVVKVFILGALCAAVSAVFVVMLHKSGDIYRKCFKNPYVRVFAGGVFVILLTHITGTRDYNGAGIGLIERAIFEGETDSFAFLLKMLFTAVTLGAGFKGGEIVPSFCVGAVFGCLFGHIAGFSPSFCAALGMAAVFCGVTNCPLTTLLVSFELFGFAGIPYFMIVISVSYMLSGYRGLYSDQIIVYSKYRPQFINRHVGDDADDDLTDSF